MPVADKAAVPAAPEAEVPAAAPATATTRGRRGVRAPTMPAHAPRRPPIRGAHLSRKTRLSNRPPTCPTRARFISRRARTMANVPPAKRIPKKKSNPLRSGQNIDYKDTATLRKFISERGKIRARRVTGLSVQEQRRVAIAIKNAREVALLPYASTAR